jgi:hypothetical protein
MNTLAHRVEFKPEQSPAMQIAAATSFVRGYLFATYGKWLVLACAINAIGFSLVLWLGARGMAVWLLGAIALLAPVWLADFYFRRPAKIAARAGRTEPATRIALTPEDIEVTTRSGSASLSWSKVRAVVEAPSAFLLVLSPFAFLALPKGGMSQEAIALLEGRKSSNVA